MRRVRGFWGSIQRRQCSQAVMPGIFTLSAPRREVLIDRLRRPGNISAEEVCLRARDGAPIWVIARRTVASYVDGVPDLLQGTFIDITAQKKAQARLGDIINDLFQRIGN